jgi:hypothetical protein
MIAGVTWTSYVILGFFSLWLMTRTSKDWLDAFLVRFASACFLFAGFVGADGIIGGWISAATTTAEGAAESVGWTAVLGLVVLLLAAFLIFTWLPETWFKGQIPDALSLAGLLLPGMLRIAPDPLGNGVETALRTMSLLASYPVRALLGTG